jgi:hypothetical protein
MSHEQTPDSSIKRVVYCVRCFHLMSWEEHSSLVTSVDCPSCGRKETFGPGIYIPEFQGYTMDQWSAHKNASLSKTQSGG